MEVLTCEELWGKGIQRDLADIIKRNENKLKENFLKTSLRFYFLLMEGQSYRRVTLFMDIEILENKLSNY